MSTGRWTSVAMAAALAGGLALAGCESAAPTPKPTTLVVKGKGFSLTFPDTWQNVTTGYGSDLEIMPPDQTDPNVFRDNVLVRREYLDQPFTAEEYATVKMAKGAKVMPEYLEIEKAPATVGGRASRRLLYTYVNGDTPVTAVAYFFVNGPWGYMVMASAAAPRFPGRKAQFEEIATSFRLVDEGAAPPAPGK